jgi:hypothetical protein
MSVSAVARFERFQRLRRRVVASSRRTGCQFGDSAELAVTGQLVCVGHACESAIRAAEI